MPPPAHPYTQALLASVAAAEFAADGTEIRKRARIRGELPDPLNPPSAGCPFRSRCYKAQDICAAQAPKCYRWSRNNIEPAAISPTFRRARRGSPKGWP